jgi:hemerythrin-like metal-binding protein
MVFAFFNGKNIRGNMGRIVWRDQMALGIREIDEDHRALVDLINRLDDLAAAKRLDEAQLADCLRNLIRYTRDHFEREERLMISARFPGFEKHRDSHQAFGNAILDQAERFVTTPNGTTARDIHGILADWVLQHVLQADRDIVPHLGPRLPINPVRWNP